jgi:hypothetical protein
MALRSATHAAGVRVSAQTRHAGSVSDPGGYGPMTCVSSGWGVIRHAGVVSLNQILRGCRSGRRWRWRSSRRRLGPRPAARAPAARAAASRPRSCSASTSAPRATRSGAALARPPDGRLSQSGRHERTLGLRRALGSLWSCWARRLTVDRGAGVTAGDGARLGAPTAVLSAQAGCGPTRGRLASASRRPAGHSMRAGARPPVCAAAKAGRRAPRRSVVERLSVPGVRRLFIMDPATRRVEGLVSLSDVAAFLFDVM